MGRQYQGGCGTLTDEDSIAWYENVNGVGTNWTTHTTEDFTAILNPRSVFAADVDGDGDIDALSASLDNKNAWYENTLGDGTTWTTHTITTRC